jgi:hypothetical protein
MQHKHDAAHAQNVEIFACFISSYSERSGCFWFATGTGIPAVAPPFFLDDSC